MGSGLLALTLWAQNPFREYPSWEPHNMTLPKDYNIPAEWTFARLMYPTTHYQFDWQSEYRRGFDWREGNTNWTIDYPRSDRHLAAAAAPAHAAQRRARWSSRSISTATTTSSTTPGCTPSETGHWELTPPQIVKFREFLLRGGFFMCDDFHGADEWQVFMETMQKVFPDRPGRGHRRTRTASSTPCSISTTSTRCPGAQFIRSRSVCEKCATSYPPATAANGALARHLRRPRPADGRDLPQHGPGRLLGARRRSAYIRRSSPRSGCGSGSTTSSTP